MLSVTLHSYWYQSFQPIGGVRASWLSSAAGVLLAAASINVAHVAPYSQRETARLIESPRMNPCAHVLRATWPAHPYNVSRNSLFELPGRRHYTSGCLGRSGLASPPDSLPKRRRQARAALGLVGRPGRGKPLPYAPRTLPKLTGDSTFIYSFLVQACLRINFCATPIGGASGYWRWGYIRCRFSFRALIRNLRLINVAGPVII